VTATARTEIELVFGASGAYALTLRSDNATPESLSFSINATNTADGLSNAVTAINEKSSKTGVIASLNAAGTAVILTNATGNDVLVTDTTVPNAGTSA